MTIMAFAARNTRPSLRGCEPQDSHGLCIHRLRAGRPWLRTPPTRTAPAVPGCERRRPAPPRPPLAANAADAPPPRARRTGCPREPDARLRAPPGGSSPFNGIRDSLGGHDGRLSRCPTTRLRPAVPGRSGMGPSPELDRLDVAPEAMPSAIRLGAERAPRHRGDASGRRPASRAPHEDGRPTTVVTRKRSPHPDLPGARLRPTHA